MAAKTATAWRIIDHGVRLPQAESAIHGQSLAGDKVAGAQALARMRGRLRSTAMTKRRGSLMAVLAMTLGLGQSQTGPAARPEFEVASVKPCKDALRSGVGTSSPGRLNVTRRTLEYLIQQAYDVYASGKPDPTNSMIAHFPVEGGPEWIASDLYTIDARPDSSSTQEMNRGPMMQRLLEDRFKLEIRRVTRETDVYALVVAKGGIKAKAHGGRKLHCY
jgi:hypothetical protein